jgi:tricorn protease-like protein
VRSSTKCRSHGQHFKTTDGQYHDLQLLVDDARRCLQMSIDAIRKHCMEIYQSALIWIPKKSLIRQVYATYVSRVPTVTRGLLNTWGPAELTIHNGSEVNSVAISHDGSRVVSGSNDTMVRVWNAATGEMEVELRGHTGVVRSVAFSPDSSRVVSGSGDKMIRIWNVMTGEMEVELKGHTDSVRSVAFLSGRQSSCLRFEGQDSPHLGCHNRQDQSQAEWPRQLRQVGWFFA